MSENHTLARPYAEMAILLARRSDTTPDWAATLSRLGAVICSTKNGPTAGPRTISEQQTRDCLAGAGQPLSEQQRKFVGVLANKGRLDVLPEIAEAFAELCGIPSNLASGKPGPMPAVPDRQNGTSQPGVQGDRAKSQEQDGKGQREEQDVPPKTEKLSFSEFELLDLDVVPEVVPEAIDVRADIEAMPRLQSRICGIWGTQELDAFLSSLVMDSRDGARAGFPVEVAAELLFLTELNKMVRAYDFAKMNSMNINAAFKAVDQGDVARHKHDVWDNPNSSPGTVFRETRTGAVATRNESAGHKNFLVSLFEFLMMLVINKWVLGAIAIVLTARFLWGK